MASAVLAFAAAVQAQPLPPEAQLPGWAQTKWELLAKARRLSISQRINPFVWRGDFDGDGRVDLAMFVRAASGKEGIAFILRSDAKPILVGAGIALGNGGDDFSWIETWTVRDAPQPPAGGKSGAAMGEALEVVKESSAGALIQLRSGKPIWRQQGD